MSPVDLDWERVDASWLPAGWVAHGDDGLIASFHDDGQLARLAWMEASACVAELLLEHRRPRGRELSHRGAGGTTDACLYADGLAEDFNAWSDNARPYPVAWRAWVTRAIADLAAMAWSDRGPGRGQ